MSVEYHRTFEEMNYLVSSVALLLAAFIGFSAHRASLCTVKAVAELLSSRRGFILTSFAKTTVWVAMIYGTLLLFLPSASGTFQVYEPRALVLIGGFLFGVGAAINGGCSLSTLQRLADGDLWTLLTLAGIGTGILAWSIADVSLGLTHSIHLPLIWPQLGGWAAAILAVLWMLAAWELIRLWRSRPGHLSLWRLPGVAAYRLSTAALIIGLSGGLLYGLQGAWTYSNYLRTSIESIYRHSLPPSHFQAALFAALLAGMVASSLQRSTFKPRLNSEPAGLARRYVGGVIMGSGAAAVPGGNDTLMLTGIPTLSGWSLGAYIALLMGVASVLVVMRIFTGHSLHIECAGDTCVEKEQLKAHNPIG